MFTNSNIPIAIEKHGPVYDVSIGDPPVKRQFLRELPSRIHRHPFHDER